MHCLEDLARTYMTVTRFPDGDVKVSGMHRPRPSPRIRVRPKTSTLECQYIAAKRAATVVFDLAKYYQLSYLHTLTYRGAVTDRGRVQRDFKRWLRLVREVLPEFFCVAVFEFHKGGGANHGGIHLHLATDRFYPVQVLRSAWWRTVGDGDGNIQIERRLYKDSFRRVGAYLAKYVAKDFDSLPRDHGQHRYLRSRSLRVPREKLVFFKGNVRQHYDLAQALLIFNSPRGVGIGSRWVSDDGLQFCFKSWGPFDN